MPTPDGKLVCVAISGGGIRGILAAQTLRFVESYLKRPIWQVADIVAGVSTGGLMALALTKPAPLSATDCSNLYVREGKRIFSRSPWRAAYTLDGLNAPKYDGSGLRIVLEHTYGASVLEEALCPTFVVTYDLAARVPTLLRSWRATGTPRPLVDVGMATSAAPTYFPPAPLQGSYFADGGLVANNPTLSGIIEVCKMYGAHTKDVLVLSIGTGSCRTPIDGKSALFWGKVGWVSPLIDIMLDGGPDLTDAQVRDLLPDANYVHIEPTISAAQASMDDTNPANLASLIAIGQSAIDLQKKQLLALLDRF